MNSKKIKLLIINPLTSTDGISKVLSDYVKNYSSNIDVELLTYKLDNNIYFKDLDIKIYELGSSKNFFKRIKEETQIIKSNNYDVVHINGNYCSRIFDCIASKRAGVKKVIIHSHNTSSGNDNKVKKIVHILTKKMFDFIATDYFACSDEAAKWMFSRKIYRKKKYHIVKNGIEIDKYRYDEKLRRKIRKEFGLNEKFVIGHIGRFQYQKNHAFIIDAFFEVQKQKENSVLLLIGSGELEESIMKKVNELNISNKVLFLGNRGDAYKFYNAMDCFILPSLYEGLGIVAIEAQTSGLPTIVYKAVPNEACISKQFIKIDSYISTTWSDAILNTKKANRTVMYKDTIKKGYNIIDVVADLEKKYIDNRTEEKSK